MTKTNNENEGFEDAISKAIPKGIEKKSKLVPEESYKQAKVGVDDANKDTPDPKERIFKFKAGRGKLMIFVPRPKNKTDIQLGEKAIAQLAQDQKETVTFRVYGIGPGEEDYMLGDMVHLTSQDGWISVKIDGFIMKIIENYQVLGRMGRENEVVR